MPTILLLELALACAARLAISEYEPNEASQKLVCCHSILRNSQLELSVLAIYIV